MIIAFYTTYTDKMNFVLNSTEAKRYPVGTKFQALYASGARGMVTVRDNKFYKV